MKTRSQRGRAKKKSGHKKRTLKMLRITVRALSVLAVLAALCGAAFLVMQSSGKNSLYKKADKGQMLMSFSELSETEDKGYTENWQEGDVRYQGIHYRYNEDILTFLFLGIDKKSEVRTVKNGIDGGQSDAIFLLVLNPRSKEINVIGIPRDTMAEIEVYDKDGSYMGTAIGQITLQHGYGDGASVSCERSRKAVSKLFYGLPVHGYCAINMGAVPLINDAVGGVELTALETIDYSGFHMKEGETVHLEGMEAYHYLHYRDISRFGSAGARLERQKQYLTVYAATAIEAMKKDITLPVTLYDTLNRYMVTDISIDEVSYLAVQMLGYHFDGANIYSLEGETVRGEKFEEFYADETALYELILDVFYEEMED